MSVEGERAKTALKLDDGGVGPSICDAAAASPGTTA